MSHDPNPPLDKEARQFHILAVLLVIVTLCVLALFNLLSFEENRDTLVRIQTIVGNILGCLTCNAALILAALAAILQKLHHILRQTHWQNEHLSTRLTPSEKQPSPPVPEDHSQTQ